MTILCLSLILVACSSPKSEIGNVQFQSPNKINNYKEDIFVYELLEPMKSYCDFSYSIISFKEDGYKSNEKFFNFGTCFFNIKEWDNAPNFTFRYTTIPNKKEVLICDIFYLYQDFDKKNCIELNDYVRNIYHTIPENAWETYTINTQEIIKNSIQDNNPIGEKITMFRPNYLRFGKERDRKVELSFYPAIDPRKIYRNSNTVYKCPPLSSDCISYKSDGRFSEQLDIRNYWKYQRNTSWN